MKYRVLEINGFYEVQFRPWWWPFWTSDEHWVRYDKPKRGTRYGGFFGDIGYETTVYGRYSTLFHSQLEAEVRVEELKRKRQREKERRKEKKKVVSTF